MSEKSISKTLNASYSSVIDICKLLKPHATNIMLLPDNKILMQPVIPGIRNYMITNSAVDYSSFIYTYFSLPDISKANTKFRKTKSEINWEIKKGEQYLKVEANDENNTLVRCPVFTNKEAIEDLITATYSRILLKCKLSLDIIMNNTLVNESSSMYCELDSSFIEQMIDKKLCEINIRDQSILISRPFLGDLKKTEWLGYRIVDEDEYRFILKFKQTEKIGNIYTYAAFLKY